MISLALSKGRILEETLPLLEAAGVAIELDPQGVEDCIDKTGFGFCLAARFHPAFRYTGPSRREIGIPTVFNLLGPMANPGRVHRQLIGVANPLVAERMLASLRLHGSTRAWVVHGNGLDELTTTGTSTVLALDDGEVRTFTVDPVSHGLAPAIPDELVGGTPDVNAECARRVFAGDHGAHRNIVVLNAGAALMVAGLVAGCEAPPQKADQNGYRGTGMVQITNAKKYEAKLDANKIPEPQPAADASGDKASKAYQNVKVLGHLSEGQFLRVMTAITEWVAPEQGCGYCHNLENLADDSMYTKVVARRMLQMTQHINEDWKAHVASTGVTCYTCHRGNPVPQNIWFADPGHVARGSAADPMGQNEPADLIARSSLPRDPFSIYLLGAQEIRVASTSTLSDTVGRPIQAAEKTYALMTHMSEGLGVNCTFCHNSRSFGNWEESTPVRVERRLLTSTLPEPALKTVR